jgi:hypothetical protein
MKRQLIIYFFFLLLLNVIVYSRPREDNPWNNNVVVPPRVTPLTVTKAQVPLNINNISTFIWNTGVFNQDLRTNNTPGFEWPRGTGKFAIFTTGLSIGALYQNSVRLANASYNGEYSPGYVENSEFKTDSRFKIYKVQAGDNEFTNPDYANWGQMVPFGAPYVDINNNHQYDPGVDVPGIKDAGQTIFVCLTDADPTNHTNSEGFSGGTLPLFAEVHLTAWAYSTPGLEDIQFIQWVVINKSPVQWTAARVSIVCDPDLGDANDDYIGCDTNLNLGFCYNSDNQDGTGAGITYGASPPASGMDYFISPIVPTGNPNDSVVLYNPPGSENKIVKFGYRELGLTSFVYFTNTGSGPPVCENDPSAVNHAYNYMSGIKRDGTPWINPMTNQRSKFCYPGDPETGTGWTEYQGRIENCGGDTTGSVVTPAPSGDRRFIFNSGSDNFTVNPNDTQYIVLAQMVARGSDNKNSVTLLKGLSGIAQIVYDLNFKVIPPPPPPVVAVSTDPNSDIGTFDLTFSWGDTSETYNFEDLLFNTGFYKFQGYEVYEIKKTANTFPDFTKPQTINDDVKLLAIYDYKDTIGIILDSFKTGVTINGNEQYALFPIVPPYKSAVPAGFPNSGLKRSITLSTTAYQEVNGGRSQFIYGNTYKFAIIAYGYNPNGLKGGKVIRNSISTQLITITPEQPLAGTHYFYNNGDTLFTSKRDLGVVPIVKAREKLKDASYMIQFYGPDTTYRILRSFDNFTNSVVLKSGLKASNDLVTTVDDSARIFDGVLFKVYKLKFDVANGNYTGNAGVIKDPTNRTDSSQTRQYGWEYNPPQNRNLEGGKFAFSGSFKPWQSVSMSLSYPTRLTFSGFRSLLNPEDLRKVKIVFTGYGGGQQAYRYSQISTINFQYQDMKEVPFKVYEVEPYDGTPNPRQLNVAFLEFPDGSQNSKWEPTTDSSGGKDMLYIFASDYDPNPNNFYTSKNLLLNQAQVDIMYTWNAKLINSGPAFNNNDELTIYPYTVTRSEIAPGYPLFYFLTTKQPIVSNDNAKTNNDLDLIRIVPNPYYGFNSLETSSSGRFVTFRRLPKEVTIKLYTLNGDLIRTLQKNDNNSTLRWDLNNLNSIPVASGIYIALIDAPGIGNKVLKLAVFTPQERVDF